MADELEMPQSDTDDDEGQLSLVERVFDQPDTVSQGEYWAIYEFLLDPDIRDDPAMIAGVLCEFSGWSQYMLKRLLTLGLISQEEAND
jgi:hypothetical protein